MNPSSAQTEQAHSELSQDNSLYDRRSTSPGHNVLVHLDLLGWTASLLNAAGETSEELGGSYPTCQKAICDCHRRWGHGLPMRVSATVLETKHSATLLREIESHRAA